MRVVRLCAERGQEDEDFCGYGQPGDEILAVLDLGDRRVTAAVAVAPVGAAFGEGAARCWTRASAGCRSYEAGTRGPTSGRAVRLDTA